MATAGRSGRHAAVEGRRFPWPWAAVGAALLVAAAATAQWLRPLPPPVLHPVGPASRVLSGPSLAIPWPSAGEAALGVAGVGTLGVHGPSSPVPIASLAKVMTALLVLRSHPLAPGAGGPTLQVTAADVALYRTEAAEDQSVLPVAAAERLNERQLLQGLLLLGANNAAIMLARWDAGSQRAFVAQMNATARALGLQQTHFADASGLSPATVSTAADLLRLAAVAMAIPTFRHIVAEPQATLPVAGTVYNVDSFLGRAGIVGIKTGATTAAGGCDLAAAYRTIGGHRELVLAAVLGQQGVQPLLTALQAGEALVVAAGTAMRPVVPLRQGTVVANLSVPWAAPVPVVAARSVTAVGWPGLQARRHIQTLALAAGQGVRRGARVGRLTLTLGAQGFTEPLVAAGAIPPPPLSWRLLRR